MPISTETPDLKFAANLRKSPGQRGTHRPCILQAALVALFRRQKLDQTGHQRRPARLVVCAHALSRVPCKYSWNHISSRQCGSSTNRASMPSAGLRPPPFGKNKVVSRHDSSSEIWAGFNRRPLPVGNPIVNASP